MVTKLASDLLHTKNAVEDSNSEEVPLSARATQLFEQMQAASFADGVKKFMSMSPKEMGEAARKAVAVRKASK